MKGNILEGEYLTLRPLGIEDADGPYVGWLNDPEVTAFNSHGDEEYTKEKACTYIETVSASETSLVYAIVAKASGKHIGNISLQEIDRKNESAEFAILIGDKNYWGKGVGAEAGKLIIEYGFDHLELHRIWCGTSEKNMGMQKLAAKLGFVEEGRRKHAMKKNGVFVDIIEYGHVRTDI